MLARAVGKDRKGWLSILFYLLGIGLAGVAAPRAGLACFVAVALLWGIPDRRIERAL